MDWIQDYTPQRLFFGKIKITEFLIDETQIKMGSSELIWLWVAMRPTKDKEILSTTLSKERKMFVAEKFLSNILKY